LAIGDRRLVLGAWLFGYSMFDVRCSMLNVECSMFSDLMFGPLTLDSGLGLRRGLSHVTQIGERIKTSRVPIGPHRLDRIVADIDDAQQLEGFRPKGLLRVLIKVAHDIDLALATGARAGATELLKRHKALRAVVPLDGEFGPDDLDVCRLHREDSKVQSPNSKAIYMRTAIRG